VPDQINNRPKPQLFKRHEQHEHVLMEYVRSARDLSSLNEQKDLLFKQFGNNKQFTEKSFNATFMRICLVRSLPANSKLISGVYLFQASCLFCLQACRNYPLGKMFFSHLKEDTTNLINPATLRYYIQCIQNQYF
jgi:hypothetical protein